MTLALIIPVAVLAYLTGKYLERAEWNKLIDEGIIPRPRKRKQV